MVHSAALATTASGGRLRSTMQPTHGYEACITIVRRFTVTATAIRGMVIPCVASGIKIELHEYFFKRIIEK